MTIGSRNTTLNRELMVQLDPPKRYTKKDCQDADIIQHEILYNNDENKYKSCIFCGKPNSKRNDHFISIIKDGRPSYYGNHPLNMVHCCPACNNEKKKMECINLPNSKYKVYYDYLLKECPKIPITYTQEGREFIDIMFKQFKVTCDNWDRMVREEICIKISKLQIYTEDIDAP